MAARVCQGEGVVMSIIQVLRRPAAANAYYHAECYTGQNEIVCGVLRLKDDQRCSECGGLIVSGLCDDREEEDKLVQLLLF